MYTIVDLGDLPGYEAEALDLNQWGTVVGVLRATMPGTSDAAFIWRQFSGGLQKLPSKVGESEARAINDAGVVAGAVANVIGGGFRAAVWDVQQNLQMLPPPAGFHDPESFTHDINATGIVVGGFIEPGPQEIPLRWLNPQQPPSRPANNLGGVWNEAVSVNIFGLAVGSVAPANGNGSGFFWPYGTSQISTLQPQGTFSSPWHIDDGGVIVGELNGQAAVWTNGAVQVLQPFADFAPSVATGRNQHGYVVGDASQQVGGNVISRAFLFRPLGGTKSLNDLIDPTLGWDLQHATAINSADQIVGWGLRNGVKRSFLMSPIPTGLSFAIDIVAIVTRILTGGLLDNSGFGLGPVGPVPIPPWGPEIIAMLKSSGLRDIWLNVGMLELAGLLSQREERARLRHIALEGIRDQVERLMREDA